MATFGSIGEFNDKDGSWTQYVERMSHYFAANDISDGGKQRSILLSVCGASMYNLISSLCAPSKPGELSYSELVTLVTNHREPKPSVIVQRFKFNTRVQKERESLAEYLAELKRLADYCEFGSMLKEMPRDRMVCGVRDERVQRRLLAEPDLRQGKETRPRHRNRGQKHGRFTWFYPVW
ncbi:uncharacterized protein [Diadema antillarum]|uniref:uncharacterized protein n=1 Tax=Diadema antillarum TaxID=105358 RepID=UPI003A849578